MDIETALAKASLTRVEQRDPYKLFHKLTRAQLQALTPVFPLGRVSRQPSALPRHRAWSTSPSRRSSRKSRRSSRRAASTIGRPICAGTWCTPRRRIFPPPFVDAEFRFLQQVLCAASQQMQPRWKRCVQLRGSRSGRSAGPGVRRRRRSARTPKQRALVMTKEIEKAMESEIEQLPWMSDATKKQALEKLHADGQQDRLSRQVARLQLRRDRARTISAATSSAPSMFESQRAAGQDRQAAWTAASGR